MNVDECWSIASEGEHALREGDATRGIKALENALSGAAGDLVLLSTLHSQLGNAYYARRDYMKARSHHLSDLNASRLQKDDLQQAKAYSNLSATYILLHDFDNAIVCANSVISIARKMSDKALECRGIYNLGLAYLHCATQGVNEMQDEDQMNKNLQQAAECFRKHLVIADERRDQIFCGLGFGNLGNAYFYMGDYIKSIECHEKRIELANELGDRASIRRSYTNIANAYVLLKDYGNAIKFYNLALDLAHEMKIPELESQLNLDLENLEFIIKSNRGSSEHLKRFDDLAYTSANTSFETDFTKLCSSEITKTETHSDEDEFFDRIARLSNKRIADQRADIPSSLATLARDVNLKDSAKSNSRRFSLSSVSKSGLRPVVKSFSNLKKLGTLPNRRKNHDATTDSIAKNRSESNPSIKSDLGKKVEGGHASQTVRGLDWN